MFPKVNNYVVIENEALRLEYGAWVDRGCLRPREACEAQRSTQRPQADVEHVTGLASRRLSADYGTKHSSEIPRRTAAYLSQPTGTVDAARTLPRETCPLTDGCDIDWRLNNRKHESREAAERAAGLEVGGGTLMAIPASWADGSSGLQLFSAKKITDRRLPRQTEPYECRSQVRNARRWTFTPDPQAARR